MATGDAVRASTDLDTLSDFFDRYGVALTTGDVPAIAGCYALPGLVVADTYSFSFSTMAAVALSFVGAAPDYQQRQLVAAHALIEEVEPVSALLTMVPWGGSSWTARAGRCPGNATATCCAAPQDGPMICTVIRTG